MLVGRLVAHKENFWQEAFRERKHFHICDIWHWRVTLTLRQGKNKAYVIRCCLLFCTLVPGMMSESDLFGPKLLALERYQWIYQCTSILYFNNNYYVFVLHFRNLAQIFGNLAPIFLLNLIFPIFVIVCQPFWSCFVTL